MNVKLRRDFRVVLAGEAGVRVKEKATVLCIETDGCDLTPDQARVLATAIRQTARRIERRAEKQIP